MSNEVILSFILIFVPIFISRYLMEKALKELDAEMKVKLLDAFSNQRKYNGFILLPVIIIYFVLLKTMPEYSMLVIGIFGLAFIVYYALSRILAYRKMVMLQVPENYLKKYKISTWLVALGFIMVGIQICYLFWV